MELDEKCAYPRCRSRDLVLTYYGRPLCSRHERPATDDRAAQDAWRAELGLKPLRVVSWEALNGAIEERNRAPVV